MRSKTPFSASAFTSEGALGPIVATSLLITSAYGSLNVIDDANLTLDSLLITTSTGGANIWDDIVPSLPETIWTRIAA